jgi:prepilin-type processing-associated H-X9-DG protein
MIAEERMLYESQMTLLDEVSTYSSGWEWPRDQLTARRNKKGNVVLADGHVETVRPEFGQQKEHYDPLE